MSLDIGAEIFQEDYFYFILFYFLREYFFYSQFSVTPISIGDQVPKNVIRILKNVECKELWNVLCSSLVFL